MGGIFVRAALALPGGFATPAGLVGPMGHRHPGHPFRPRRVGRRVLRGGGRQLTFLDELPKKPVKFGLRGQKLAQGHVLAAQISLRKLRREV